MITKMITSYTRDSSAPFLLLGLGMYRELTLILETFARKMRNFNGSHRVKTLPDLDTGFEFLPGRKASFSRSPSSISSCCSCMVRDELSVRVNFNSSIAKMTLLDGPCTLYGYARSSRMTGRG